MTHISYLTLLFSFLSPLTPAYADGTRPTGSEVIEVGFVEDTGAANRILAGDTLRALSQEIPAAVCHLHNDVDAVTASDLLAYSVATFDKTLTALLHGDADLGIDGPEQRRKTIVALEQLQTDWTPIRQASVSILNDPTDAAAAQTVYAAADDMLDQTYRLLSGLEAEYANPSEILQSDIMLLEVSGRMAAMNQRLAFEACRVWSGDHSDDAVAALRQSMSIYENSLLALRGGMPETGIQPPPTAEIDDKLRVISDQWSETATHLDLVASGDEISPAIKAAIYSALTAKLHHIEDLEVLYQDYSKRVY